MKKKVRQAKPHAEPLNIFLLGDFAAGKATQSKLLVKEFGLYDFDMGEEQARRRLTDPAYDAVLRRTVDKGKLSPTSWPRKIVRETIAKVPPNKGIIFDGHPKMLGEAERAVRLLKKHKRSKVIFLYLTIPWSETVKRTQRRIGYSKGAQKRRADDSATALRNRFRFVRSSIKQVAPYFRSIYPHATISGVGTVAQVHKRVLAAIERLTKVLSKSTNEDKSTNGYKS